MRVLIVIVALSVGACASRGELRSLNDAAGRCVEVAIDFTLKRIEIEQNGTVYFEAYSTEAGKDIGFIVVVDEPKADEIGVYGGGTMPIMRAGIVFRSIGAPTSLLDQLLRDKLQDRKQDEDSFSVAGVYSGLSSQCGGSLAGVIILHANGVGISFDEKGKETSGDGFRTILVADVPMARMTAYFSKGGAYSGTSPADRARTNWLQKEKAANHSPKPTPSAVH